MTAPGDVDPVERVRQVHELFNRREFDAVLRFAHPEIECQRPGGQAPLHGRAELREWLEPSAFESQTLEPLAFEVAGSKVLVQALMRARGAGSGIEMELESWIVWTLDDDGLVRRIDTYFRHEEAAARAAAGL